MMRKKTVIMVFVSLPIVLPLLTFVCAFLNSVGCNYKLTMQVDNVKHVSVCRFGEVGMVETDIDSGDKWQISGRQFSIFEHDFYYISSRTHLVAGGKGKESKLNDYNNTIKGFMYINKVIYRLNEDNVVVLFGKMSQDINIGRIDGYLDFEDFFFHKNSDDK